MFKLFRPKQNEAPFEKIDIFVRDELGESLSKKMSEMEESISASLEEIKKSVAELGKVENANTFTNSLKNKYCKKSQESIEAVPAPGPDYESKKAFIDKCAYAARLVSDIDIKELRHLGAFSIKMSKISSGISQLNRLCSPYLFALEGSVLKKIYEARAMKSGLDARYDAYISAKSEMNSMKKSSGFVEGRMISLKAKTEEVKRRISEIDGMRSETHDEEKRKNTIETTVSTEIGSVERVIRKFVHDCKDEAKKDIVIMEKYAKSPFETFLNDSDIYIRQFLINIREASTGGKFNPGEDIAKVDRLIRSMDFLVSMRNEYAKITDNIEKFHKKIENMKKPHISNSESTEEEIEKFSSEKKKIDAAIEKKKAEIRTIESEIKEREEKLVEWIKTACGREVRIKYPEVFREP